MGQSTNKDGAVGIVLNYKIMTITASQLFLNSISKNVYKFFENDILFHIGGPTFRINGFILHTKDYESKNTIKVSKQVKLTCSTEIISDIAKNKGPKQFFISLGYSGWGPGQLENEIKQNSWINLNEELDLLFEIDPEKKWKNALQKTGIDFQNFQTSSAMHKF